MIDVMRMDLVEHATPETNGTVPALSSPILKCERQHLRCRNDVPATIALGWFGVGILVG